jgi:hypothetical protein
MVGRSLKALYWVTSDDHGEDWFVIAGSQEEAVRFHAQEEGYDPGDAIAEHIVDLPDRPRAAERRAPGSRRGARGPRQVTSP